MTTLNIGHDLSSADLSFEANPTTISLVMASAVHHSLNMRYYAYLLKRMAKAFESAGYSAFRLQRCHERIKWERSYPYAVKRKVIRALLRAEIRYLQPGLSKEDRIRKIRHGVADGFGDRLASDIIEALQDAGPIAFLLEQKPQKQENSIA